jgi:putative ABC transport system permease protein
MSILGVAIGIAAIVAVLGITRSSQADVLARLDLLGTKPADRGERPHGWR